MLDEVISPDGTPIACYRSGSGLALVLVPGTGAANPRAWPAFPLIEEHFTAYAVYRRGRNESGDQLPYAVEREYEDIAAVVNSVGEPANLLGHSFGGLLALEAALLTDNLDRLVLYEAAVPLPGKRFGPEGSLERIQTLLDAGDKEGVLTLHYSEIGMSPEEIDQMRSSPAWQERLDLVHTYPREMKAEEEYVFDARRFTQLRTPTLLLVGEDSLEIFKESAAMLDEALPNSQISVMPGQEHIAMYTAPQLFLNELLAFLA